MTFDRDYFDRYYGDYFRQNPPGKLDYYLRLVRNHVGEGRLLDIGCSYGLFVERASSQFRCLGMDVDPDVVARAAARVPRASFAAGMLPHIPCSGVDVITLLDVAEHVPDLDAAMRSIRNALRPGGIALVVVPVYDGPLGPLVHRLDKDPTHIHQKSRRFWLELAGRHFELLEWQGVFRKLLFGRLYLNLPSRLFRGISPAIVMVLRNSRTAQS
jgi:SAM-dependent methyltransferase